MQRFYLCIKSCHFYSLFEFQIGIAADEAWLFQHVALIHNLMEIIIGIYIIMLLCFCAAFKAAIFRSTFTSDLN